LWCHRAGGSRSGPSAPGCGAEVIGLKHLFYQYREERGVHLVVPFIPGETAQPSTSPQSASASRTRLFCTPRSADSLSPGRIEQAAYQVAQGNWALRDRQAAHSDFASGARGYSGRRSLSHSCPTGCSAGKKGIPRIVCCNNAAFADLTLIPPWLTVFWCSSRSYRADALIARRVGCRPRDSVEVGASPS
jgi:hypothetical protein